MSCRQPDAPSRIVDATPWVRVEGLALARQRRELEAAGWPGMVEAHERVVIREDGRTETVWAYRFGDGA